MQPSPAFSVGAVRAQFIVGLLASAAVSAKPIRRDHRVQLQPIVNTKLACDDLRFVSTKPVVLISFIAARLSKK
jgi:hypothetical protein